LELINTTGCARATLRASLNWEWDAKSDQRVLVVTDVPPLVNLQKLFVVLRDQLSENLIYIRDESKSSPRIVIGRHKRIRRISDEELEVRVRRVCERNVQYRMYIAHDGVARLLTPIQTLEIALEHAVRANAKWLTERIRKLELEILFERIKKPLAEMLLRGDETEVVLSTLQITSEQLSMFISKSLASLRSREKDTMKLTTDVLQLTEMSQDPLRAFGKEFKYL
jgi:hypothetical protein